MPCVPPLRSTLDRGLRGHVSRETFRCTRPCPLMGQHRGPECMVGRKGPQEGSRCPSGVLQRRLDSRALPTASAWTLRTAHGFWDHGGLKGPRHTKDCHARLVNFPGTCNCDITNLDPVLDLGSLRRHPMAKSRFNAGGVGKRVVQSHPYQRRRDALTLTHPRGLHPGRSPRTSGKPRVGERRPEVPTS